MEFQSGGVALSPSPAGRAAVDDDDDHDKEEVYSLELGDSKTNPTSGNHHGNGIDDVDDKNNIDDEKKLSPLSKSESLPLEATKGKGLRKWRRIQRRDIDGGGGAAATGTVDPSRILKRDSSGGSAAVTSTAAAVAGDSDNNSENPSSKSSTAASVPKSRYQHHHHHHHNHNRSSSTASSSHRARTPPTTKNHLHNNTSARFSPIGRQNNKMETTKKLRGGGGGGIKLDKEASYSSVESDLRSSNIFFTETGNGRHINYDVDNSSEAQASDQQSNDYFFKDNGEDSNELSLDDDDDVAPHVSWEPEEERSDNHHPSTSPDLLAESIISLQAVHQALEKELQNFGEIGKEPILLSHDSTEHLFMQPEFHYAVSGVHETISSGQAPFENIQKSSSLPLEAELVDLQRKVSILESKLEETMTMLIAKESRIRELEGINNERELSNEESGSSVQSLQEKCKEMETELEDLFMQKIEAEVECLTMRRASQKFRVASEDQIMVLEEQKTLIGEQNKILHKFRDAGSNIITMKVKDQVAEVASSGESLDTAEVLWTQSRICKYTFCFLVQLLLLLLAVGLLFLQLWPGSAGSVPT